MRNGRYNPVSSVLFKRFGGRVKKVTYRIGLSCPNRDGSKGVGGCSFCSGEELVPEDYMPGEPAASQIRRGIASSSRNAGGRAAGFIAYLQDHTATHCGPELLERTLLEAAGVEGIVGLSVGTRPDCLGGAVLDVLERVNGRIPLWLELGLQSSSDGTLAAINRNHTAAEFSEAVAAANRRGIRTVAHVVLGLPGEGPEETSLTAEYLARTGADGVKLHNLLVLKGTPLESDYEAGRYSPPSLDRYADMAVNFLERIPWGMAVHRLAASAPARLLVAPAWASDKGAVIRTIEGELEKRGAYQGRLASIGCGCINNRLEERLETVHQA